MHWGRGTQLAALRSRRAYLLIVLGLVAIVAWGFWGSLAAATLGAVVLVVIARLFAGHD